MTDRFERFLRQVDDHLTLDPAERQQVLGELRSHLAETASEMQRLDPDQSVDEIQAKVVEDFGAPADLALAYNPRGSVVLTDASGATVLTFSAAVTKAGKLAGEAARTGARAVGKGAGLLGRGAGKAIKVGFLGILILLGVALLSASIVAVFLFDDIRDVVESNIHDSIHSTYIDCRDSNCTGPRGSTSFFLGRGASSVSYYYEFHAAEENATGTATVQLIDPNGRMVLNTTFDATLEHRTSAHGKFQPVEGYWELRIVMDGYNGRYNLDVDAAGLTRAA